MLYFILPSLPSLCIVLSVLLLYLLLFVNYLLYCLAYCFLYCFLVCCGDGHGLCTFLGFFVNCCWGFSMLWLFLYLFSFLIFGEFAPMFFLLTNTSKMILEIHTIESMTTINTNHGAWSTSATNMSLNLFFLQSKITILAYKCYHINFSILIILL